MSLTQELPFIYLTSVMSRIKPFHVAALRLSWEVARCRLSDLSSTVYLLTKSIYNFCWMVYRDGLLPGLLFRGKAWMRREEFWGATIARITRFFSYLALTVLHYSPYNCLSDIITSTYFVTSCAIASAWLRPGLRFIFSGVLYTTPTSRYPSYVEAKEMLKRVSTA